jgi:hypothetical protein
VRLVKHTLFGQSVATDDRGPFTSVGSRLETRVVHGEV